MPFLLNSHNVFEYLVELGLCNNSEQATSKVEPVAAKNFNLLVTFDDSRKLLVVASGLLEATEQGFGTASGRMKAILEQFSRKNIDLQRVHLNANSTDVYTSLF